MIQDIYETRHKMFMMQYTVRSGKNYTVVFLYTFFDTFFYDIAISYTFFLDCIISCTLCFDILISHTLCPINKAILLMLCCKNKYYYYYLKIKLYRMNKNILTSH